MVDEVKETLVAQLFVKVTLVEAVTVPAFAVTVYERAMASLNVAVATPEAEVVGVAGENVAPVGLLVNETLSPGSGFPLESLTVAMSVMLALFATALVGEAVRATELGAPRMVTELDAADAAEFPSAFVAVTVNE
jgi:hypothetical protein